MTWFILAFSTACCEGVKDLLSKKSLARRSPLVVTICLSGCTALLLLPLLIWQGFPPLTTTYVLALVTSAILNSTAFLFYNQALQITDLSLVVPIIAISPLFMFVTSPLIVGEFGQLSDLVGSGLILAGSYALNWDQQQRNSWAPFKALWQNPGCRQMLLVAFIWSFTSNIDKVGIQSSSVFCWIVSLYGTIALILLARMTWQSHHQDTPSVPSQFSMGLTSWLLLGGMGSVHALGIFLQMQALQLTLVVRVITVKRLSTLIGVFLGAIFLKEQGFRHRLLGAALMVAGVAVLL